MPDRSRSGRTVEQLLALLDDPAEWRLYGRHGVLIGSAASLRAAVEEAKSLETRGTRTVAIVLGPDSDIIVFSAQITLLAERIAKQ
jgi:hypothetical protein